MSYLWLLPHVLEKANAVLEAAGVEERRSVILVGLLIGTLACFGVITALVVAGCAIVSIAVEGKS